MATYAIRKWHQIDQVLANKEARKFTSVAKGQPQRQSGLLNGPQTPRMQMLYHGPEEEERYDATTETRHHNEF